MAEGLGLELGIFSLSGTIRGLCSEDTGQGPPLMCQHMEIAGKGMSPLFVSGHLVHRPSGSEGKANSLSIGRTSSSAARHLNHLRARATV